MQPEITYIPTSGKFASIGAAMYLAVAAYPDTVEKNFDLIKKRDDFVNACKAWLAIQIMGRVDHGVIKNADVSRFTNQRTLSSQFEVFFKQMEEKRSVALHVCKLKIISERIPVNLRDTLPFTIEGYLDLYYPSSTYVPFGGKRIEESTKHKSKNAHRRIWKESKPALHLLWALDNILHTRKAPASVEDLLWNPDWVASAVEQAERIRLTIFKYQDKKWVNYQTMIQLLPEYVGETCKS